MFRGDLYEGMRGTPNFGAAASALALKHELLFQVMPDDQVRDWSHMMVQPWKQEKGIEIKQVLLEKHR